MPRLWQVEMKEDRLNDRTDWTRRDVLGAALAGVSVAATTSDALGRTNAPATARMPALFVAHGAPPLLDDPDWVRELASWSGAIARPKAVLMLSAHWEERPLTIGATRTVPLIYDFGGFAPHHYQQKYPAPGAPALAQRVRQLVSGSQKVAEDADRGLDHGAYVPLVAMYPDAGVPVLQVSLPSENPAELLALGRALRPLRDEGVLIVGSGFITHNLRTLDWRGGSPPPAWAKEFDAWTAEALVKKDVDALLDFQRKGPASHIALPTREHFVPLLVALGAAREEETVRFPIDGFWMGSLTRRSVQFG